MKALLLAVLLPLPFGSHAQQAPAPSGTSPASVRLGTAADTTLHVIDKTLLFAWGTIKRMDGQEVQAYLPVFTQYPGMDFPFDYYFTPPEVKPTPPRQTIAVEQVHSMTAGPYYFETMRLEGQKKAKILAQRMAHGPVELFLQAEQQRAPLPIPVPGAILHTAIPYTNSHFFVRRNGRLQQVERASFGPQMSQYLADYPDLAAKVARGETNYHYRDLVSIITEYNQHTATSPARSGQ
ncbi:hypothetical protein Q3A66_12750 [Hymenobacter sp. BT770]|uniref:hypothetical protein n=1 Tax=Hymenobacter sp. BT770 TaxID=2886942 RepID=UPI001D12D4A4|nr:hypothetical protein [Hymenobacter sp. BT770]MCC3153598.1 hypothetical protein [Hymenobacter sp. BT770]MDO3415936.1 hypothetical protein [Hymenobacter sp. BT770]